MAGCGYMRASVYLISFFYYRYFKCLKSLFDRFPSRMIAWIRMYRTFYLPDYQTAGLHPVICRNLLFHNGSCHPFFLCGCRFFPRGIMVCYRMGRVISITIMNYSVAIFDIAVWYAIQIMLSQNCDIAGYQNKDSRERREHAPFRIQISQNLHLQMCISSNPLMETMKKNNKAYTAICHSPFVEVYK